ncbi:MAG: cation:proton antiporter [Elusimicrobia bacterium]|nr:cation:proton antiporter [Elusimicrobiota bacterium]
MTHGSLHLLTDISLSIVFAACSAHILRLLGQPAILGYVLGGVILGPQLGLGLVTEPDSIELISEIGLIFLLFIIGLEINLKEIAKMGRAMLTLGAAQIFCCMALGFAFFSLVDYGFRPEGFELLYLSVALAMSSTMIAVKLLHDKFEAHTTAGRLTIGVLIVQDIFAVAFMAIQPNLSNPELTGIAASLGLGAALVALAFVISRYGLSRLFRASAKNPELVLLTSASWCFVLTMLAERAGLSKEMGALIAGISIGTFPYGTDVGSKLTGIRDFFTTLFFVSLGLKMPRPDGTFLMTAGLAVGFVIASRLISVTAVLYRQGKGLRLGLVTALNLAQISEFSLVMVALGVEFGHVRETFASTILGAMLLASLASTYIIAYNDRLARTLSRWLESLGLRERRTDPAQPSPEAQRDIVMLGCFREGLALIDTIEEESPQLLNRMLVIDYNAGLKERLEHKGVKWVYGDLAHAETLSHLHLEKASIVCCTISDTFLRGTTNERLLRLTKALSPNARFIATADDHAQAERLLDEGAAHALVPAKLAGSKILELIKESSPADVPEDRSCDHPQTTAV